MPRRHERRASHKPEPNISRRGFLGMLGAGIASGALSYARGRERTQTGGVTNEAQPDFYDLDRSFDAYCENILSDDMTPSERDQVRETFLRHFSEEEITEYIQAGFVNDKLDAVYRSLARVDCHGLVYKFLHTRELYNTRYRYIFNQSHGTRDELLSIHYAARAADFLPAPAEIAPEEIDPRITLQLLGKKDDNVDSDDDVAEAPAWSHPVRVEQFQAVLGDPDVRALLMQSELTLAEVFSVVKAAINMYERDVNAPERLASRIEFLLAARDTFKRKEILGPHTEHFIYFCFSRGGRYERLFDPTMIETVSKASRVNEHAMHYIDSREGKRGVEELRNAIAGSDGATTVFFHTHGLPDSINFTDTTAFTADYVAEACVDRVLRTKDTGTLEDVSILMSSCYSYDFALAVAAHIKELYVRKGGEQLLGMNADEVALPTIITAAHEASVGTVQTFAEPLAHMEPVIQKEGALTGELVLRTLQPYGYKFSDLVVFRGASSHLQEIGLRKSGTENARMG